jgi:hypothetical protein
LCGGGATTQTPKSFIYLLDAIKTGIHSSHSYIDEKLLLGILVKRSLNIVPRAKPAAVSTGAITQRNPSRIGSFRRVVRMNIAIHKE